MKSIIYFRLFSLIVLLFTCNLTFSQTDKINKNSNPSITSSATNSYFFNINNINLPIDNKGSIADVNSIGAKYDDIVFLFSGGFYLSGLQNGVLWGNGVASYARVEDYRPGPVGSEPDDNRNRIYVVTREDEPFGESWQNWKTAVQLGADFYDGDGNGIYEPVDKNGNGIWDPDEDKPDILGDVTAWTVYNDGVSKGARRFNQDPVGIEIHQTAFAYKTKGDLGNTIFFRYRIINKGTGDFDSVYFSAASDFDLGNYTDDLNGCDTLLNLGYTYNHESDAEYGDNPPAAGVSILQGPVSYVPGETFIDNNNNGVYDTGIDTPLDTAYNYLGSDFRTEIIPGARNERMSTFRSIYISHGMPDDPNTEQELRYLHLGLGRQGDAFDPCFWSFGTVVGEDCNKVNPLYMYSGDPVTNTGWINILPIDLRQIVTTGPFNITKGDEQDILIAYTVGRGNSPLSSITELRKLTTKNKQLLKSNFDFFTSPPSVTAEVSGGKNFLELKWNTPDTYNYSKLDTHTNSNLKFFGYKVYTYKINNIGGFIGDIKNEFFIESYQTETFIRDLYYQKGKEIQLAFKRPEEERRILIPSIYGNEATGRIHIRFDEDPIDGSPLLRGKEYYFAVTAVYIDYYRLEHLEKIDPYLSDYKIEYSRYHYYETDKKIVKGVFGTELFSNEGEITAERISGTPDGDVFYDIINKEDLTGDEYKVTFTIDSSAVNYSPLYTLTNTTRNEVLIENSNEYLSAGASANAAGKTTDGFRVNVKEIKPVLPKLHYIPASVESWEIPFNPNHSVYVYYAGKDIKDAKIGRNPSSVESSYTLGDKLRRVEIRFGEKSMAYRYLMGFKGSGIARRRSCFYAEAITAADTISSAFGGGRVERMGEGFIEVPFSAYIVDPVFNEERKLAIGFTEKSVNNDGNPDGNWDPGTRISLTEEYIIIFNSDYSETPQKIYTGGVFNYDYTVWAELFRGYIIPSFITGITPDERKKASSPLFDALYIASLQRNPDEPDKFFTDGDRLIISVDKYPYTQNDVYTFKTPYKGELTFEEQKELFDKVNVYPNPFFAYNPYYRYYSDNPSDAFIFFNNLPEEITIKIYSLSGTLIRSLNETDKREGSRSPFLQWDLKNENGRVVSSGVYLAIVSSPLFGEKVLKFSILTPKQ